MRRRRFLGGSVAAGLFGLAGCSSDGTGISMESLSGSEPASDVELPWTQLPGPPGGPVTDVGISAADPDWLYATTRTAGMFVSSDGGARWINGLERMHHRNRVSVSPHDPQLAYAQERTPDGGRHWYDFNHPSRHRFPPTERVNDLVWDPFDEATMYAATAAGFYRSFDDGRTWERRPIMGRYEEVRYVDVHPDREGVVIVALPNEGVARSDDRGESWSLLPGSGRIPDQVFRGFGFGDPSAGEVYLAFNAFGVYRLLDGALTKLTENLVLPWWANQLRRSADGERIYFIGGRETEDGFDGWWDRRQLFVLDTASDRVTALELPDDPTAVATHPHDPSTLYFGGVQWVWESEDGGETWTPLSNDFFDRYLAAVGTNDDHPGTVIPGSICSTGLSVSHDDGESWAWKRSGLGPFHDGEFNEHYLMQIAAAGDRAYATTAAGLLVSEDNGETWSLIENEFSGIGPGRGDGDARHLHGLAVQPDDPDVVYVGTGMGDAGGVRDFFDDVAFLWKSEDGGAGWQQITDGFPTDRDTGIQDILVSSHDPDVVYVGTNAEDYLSFGRGPHAATGYGVYRSTEAGRRWERMRSPFRNVHALAEDAVDPSVLYASTPDGVYRSSDGGEGWERVLPHETKALLAHPSRADVVFAGTRRYPGYWDVLVTTDGGATWAEGNLTVRIGRRPDTRAYDATAIHSDYAMERGQLMWFAVDEPNSLLYAATQGAGLWRADTRLVES